MSAVLEQMIAEAEMKLTELRQLRTRMSALNEASPSMVDLKAQNEALTIEWELKLGELNRALLRARFLDTPDPLLP